MAKKSLGAFEGTNVPMMPYSVTTGISSEQYKEAHARLDGPPEAFFKQNVDNCWLDTVSIALTFADGIGAPVRDALHATLVDLEENHKVMSFESLKSLFYRAGESPGDQAWNIFRMRMMAILLFGTKGTPLITCPTSKHIVKEFAVSTYMNTGMNEKTAIYRIGGVLPSAVRTLLTNLFGVDRVSLTGCLEKGNIVNYPLTGRLDGEPTRKSTCVTLPPAKNTVAFYWVTNSKGSAHYVCAFKNGGKLYLYDNETEIIPIDVEGYIDQSLPLTMNITYRFADFDMLSAEYSFVTNVIVRSSAGPRPREHTITWIKPGITAANAARKYRSVNIMKFGERIDVSAEAPIKEPAGGAGF